MQIFYLLVILTTAFALPFPGDHDAVHHERKEAMKRNPDLFDGDMLGVQKMIEEDRNGRRPKSYRWPNGVIPYVISNDIDATKRKNLAKAMDYYHENTCVEFVPRTDEQYYIRIHNGSGCSSYVGRQDLNMQPQPVSLADGCGDKGTILHELNHAVGFFHEHSRNDRDEYVEIRLENVDKKERHNFDKIPLSMAILYTKFDYHSVMIYDSTSFSKNGKKTIVPLQEGITLLDAAYKNKMTKSDLYRINAMYQCSD